MVLGMRRLLALLMLVLLLAACGGDEGDDQAAGGDSPEAPAEPARCPLTGVETTVDVTRPALAVKIDNAPPSRPQAGIQAADHVWEEIGEGGLTRFLAIFHCGDAPLLGSVRSARNVDPDILQQYTPVLFGYSGANRQVLDKVASTRGVIDLKHGSNAAAYTREGSRRAPYNLFSGTDKLRDLPAAKEVEGEPETAFEFDAALADAPPASPGATGAPPPAGNSVTFSYANNSNVRWTYDPGTKRYLRFHGDTAHKINSGEQVSAANVVIMKVRISQGSVRDASGAPTLDTAVTGSGDVTVLRGGTAVTGKWNRASVGDKTTFTDASGQTIKLAPGNTWIHLVPEARPVIVQ
jgi:hypothetical protein